MKKELNETCVLLVEDDPQMLEVMNDLVTGLGAHTQLAGNGRIAWDLVQKKKFDIIISDIRMPHMDGIQLLDKVRDIDPKFPPVLLITGESEISREGALKRGATDLLYKLFNIRDFTELIVKNLSNGKHLQH